jgi:hypothetical protein
MADRGKRADGGPARPDEAGAERTAYGLEHLEACRATLWRTTEYMSPPGEPWRDMALRLQDRAVATLNDSGPLAIPSHFREANVDVVEALRAALFALTKRREGGDASDALAQIIVDGYDALARADELPVVDAEPSVKITYIGPAEAQALADELGESGEPDYAGEIFREFEPAQALETIRKAIETIEPESLPPASDVPRDEAKAIIDWILQRRQ